MSWSKITVVGNGPFPIDMLRFLEAWPATSEDAVRIGTQDALADVGPVTVVTARWGHDWHRERWESFGWKVIAAAGQLEELYVSILRNTLDTRGYRTDGDPETIARRILHMARTDRDMIGMLQGIEAKLCVVALDALRSCVTEQLYNTAHPPAQRYDADKVRRAIHLLMLGRRDPDIALADAIVTAPGESLVESVRIARAMDEPSELDIETQIGRGA